MNKYGHKELDGRYGEGVMCVGVVLLGHTVQICHEVWGSDGKGPHAWIATALFDKLRIIIDPRYVQGGWAPLMVRELNRKQSNVEHVQKLSKEISLHLKRRNAMHVRTLRNIDKSD